MRILDRSVFVGPSLYAHFPVIRLELDLERLEAWPTGKLGPAFVDALIEALELDGTLQVAGFHPEYRFADTDADDPGNCTNRAPYPTLHLLREASLDKAIAAYPDADVIVERNLETMAKLGLDGFNNLLAE